MISKYKKFLPVVAGAAMLGLSVPAMAQTEDIDSVDDNQVQIAYRTIDKYDLLGGVATLDFEELQKKNYINDLNNTTLNGYGCRFQRQFALGSRRQQSPCACRRYAARFEQCHLKRGEGDYLPERCAGGGALW